jgi:hypothetical protein
VSIQTGSSRVLDPDSIPVMQAHGKVELALIPCAVAVIATGAGRLPTHLSVGELLTIGCVAWLVQGGIRDVWLLYRQKTRPSPEPTRKLTGMCFESTAGLTGILVGVVLALATNGPEFSLTPKRWACFAAAVFILGFLLKDFVITWRPIGLRRERNHGSIVVSWR